MKTRLTLKPGQNGTKKLMEKYGDKLLAVRYRYDAEGRTRLKTVELIEEQLEWDPVRPRGRDPNAMALLHLGFHQETLPQPLHAAPATCIPPHNLSQLTHL